MTCDELNNLARDVGAVHHGMKCRFAEKIFLPYRVYTPEVWTMEQTGPHPLDQIFFGLLKNKVNTRENIAKQLGVGENEFVFTHLDVLIHKKYVVESENGYALTEQGQKFDSGNFKEERLKKIKFPFIWNDMTACIEPYIKFSNSQAQNLNKIALGADPDEDDIILALAKYFNAEKRSEKIAFYDVASPDVGRRFPYTKKYAEYVALFYVSKKEPNDLSQIDLRIQNNSGEFHLCKKLSEQASQESYSWYEKFEKIYTEHIT